MEHDVFLCGDELVDWRKEVMKSRVFTDVPLVELVPVLELFFSTDLELFTLTCEMPCLATTIGS